MCRAYPGPDGPANMMEGVALPPIGASSCWRCAASRIWTGVFFRPRGGAAFGPSDRLLEGVVTEQSPAAAQAQLLLRAGLEDLDQHLADAAEQVDMADASGARLTSVLDSDYPANLRTIPNLPPFLSIGDCSTPWIPARWRSSAPATHPRTGSVALARWRLSSRPRR